MRGFELTRYDWLIVRALVRSVGRWVLVSLMPWRASWSELMERDELVDRMSVARRRVLTAGRFVIRFVVVVSVVILFVAVMMLMRIK